MGLRYDLTIRGVKTATEPPPQPPLGGAPSVLFDVFLHFVPVFRHSDDVFNVSLYIRTSSAINSETLAPTVFGIWSFFLSWVEVETIHPFR